MTVKVVHIGPIEVEIIFNDRIHILVPRNEAAKLSVDIARWIKDTSIGSFEEKKDDKSKECI